MADRTVLDEIAGERRRQIEAEGWTPAHDDKHANAELACAAAAYASHSACFRDAEECGVDYRTMQPPPEWPWSLEWWKPTDRRRDLIKAGALIVAEIERIDRADRAAQEATDAQ